VPVGAAIRFSLATVDKAALRERIRADGPVDADSSQAVAEGVYAWMAPQLPGTVTAFLAMPGEVDVKALFARLPGWRWVLPRVESDRSMTFRDRDAPRETHRFGMEQPADAGPVIPIPEIDVFLTPGLAFDVRGGRLGNGGGFYDRVLAARRADSAAVGITVGRRVVDAVPMEGHDQWVDWLATESGVIRCSPSR
jgi:5-formyltetrahydrofolate cyclo-ligase